MRWNELQAEPCPIARTVAVIGDRWTMLILRDALRGLTRFDEFHSRLQCSRATISDRLTRLVDHGVLSRELYEEHPPRHQYRLTDMGRSLAPVLMTMSQWADTWVPHEGARRIRRVHKACGHAFQPVLHCSECGEPVRLGEIEYLDPVPADPA